MLCEYFYMKKFPLLFKDFKNLHETTRLLFSLINEIFDPSGLMSKLLFWQDLVPTTNNSEQRWRRAEA